MIPQSGGALSESTDVLYAKQGHVATLTLDRPERRNGLTRPMLAAIEQHALTAEEDDEVRVVVLKAAGEHFSVGMDWSGSDPPSPRSRFPEPAWRNWTVGHLLQMAKPSIAAIHGTCAGGGLAFALECDIRIAADDARFATGYARTGLPVVDGVGVMLPNVIGSSRALEMLYTNRIVDAAEADRIGLVSRVVARSELDAAVAELAESIAAGPPVAQRITKYLVRTPERRAYEEHLPHQLYAMHVNRALARHDLEEGQAAFREKRAPVWRGLKRRD
jgi:2-(1,2-epoxy-1,2-dihydrophenyl)acetyl-CoA isomerase